MEYGILVAVAEDGSFQIVCAVDSLDEAKFFADEYIALGPENDYLAPSEFQIHRRSDGGAYTTVERFGIPALT